MVYLTLVKFIVCNLYLNKTNPPKLPCYMNNTVFKGIIGGEISWKWSFSTGEITILGCLNTSNVSTHHEMKP